MEVGFWGLLHDGGIDAICGEIPGAVSIEVSIRYLRQQFPGKGTGFRIDLVNCSQLAIAYESASVYLDTGEEISPNELFAASKAYWDAWSASQPAAIDEKISDCHDQETSFHIS